MESKKDIIIEALLAERDMLCSQVYGDDEAVSYALVGGTDAIRLVYNKTSGYWFVEIFHLMKIVI